REIADGSLDEVRIYFPDPWHKKRHHKRRLVNPGFAALLVRKLAPGGRLHLATDWHDYAGQMWEVLDATPGLRNRAGPRGHVPRPAARPRRLGPAVRQDVAQGLGPRNLDTALTLTPDMKLVLGLVGLTMFLFVFERIRADVVALAVLVLLGLTGLVAPEDLFDGFSGNAVISVMATMILGAGLDRTGALNRLAAWLLRRAKGVEERLLLLTGAVAGLNSSVMQNPSVLAL